MSKKAKNNRQEFLATFFDNKKEYAEKEVNGFWLVHRYDGEQKQWIVSIFTSEKMKNYKARMRLFD